MKAVPVVASQAVSGGGVAGLDKHFATTSQAPNLGLIGGAR
jgi:hypothetical protein